MHTSPFHHQLHMSNTVIFSLFRTTIPMRAIRIQWLEPRAEGIPLLLRKWRASIFTVLAVFVGMVIMRSRRRRPRSLMSRLVLHMNIDTETFSSREHLQEAMNMNRGPTPNVDADRAKSS